MPLIAKLKTGTVPLPVTADPCVLLVGDSADLALAMREALDETGRGAFALVCAATLAEATQRLRQAGVAAVLMDLDLPDSQGMASLEKLVLAAPQLPVVALGQAKGREAFMQALRCGAQDYLSKGQFDGYTLARALNGAIGRKAAEDALFIEKERAQVTLNSIGDAVLSTDAGGKVSYLNKVAETMTGWPAGQALGRPLAEVMHIIDAQTRQRVTPPLAAAIRHDAVRRLPAGSVLLRRDGVEMAIEDTVAPIHDRTGRHSGAVIVFHDVTESHRMHQKISHMAQHDGLTGLPNRMVLSAQLAGAIDLARRHGGQLAVLFLDLDNFKHINDSLGHTAGDELLKVVAQRIVTSVRASDTVCRLGGDEFVALLPEVRHAEDAARVAEHILREIRRPFLVAGHDLHVGVSIGISVFPGDGQDADGLMKNADTAMYHAKSRGRDNCQFFSEEMKVRAEERRSIEEDLRHALARSEFVLAFQPKVNLASRRITGAEALIRWNHPTRGVVGPAQFIAIAEDTGLILPIGQWALHEACARAQEMIERGLELEQIAVNVSAVEFESRGYVDNLRSVLRSTRLAPHRLELELTESILMRRPEASAATLGALSAAGVRLAVDDFGTGYSSLSYLKHFPIDTLKIDQSFVRDVHTSDNDAAIVSAIIALGASLQQRVVAEGVETVDQLAVLRAKGCAEGQGYLFSRPVAAAALAALLADAEATL